VGRIYSSIIMMKENQIQLPLPRTAGNHGTNYLHLNRNQSAAACRSGFSQSAKHRFRLCWWLKVKQLLSCHVRQTSIVKRPFNVTDRVYASLIISSFITFGSDEIAVHKAEAWIVRRRKPERWSWKLTDDKSPASVRDAEIE
jgi:hypothetical protein